MVTAIAAFASIVTAVLALIVAARKAIIARKRYRPMLASCRCPLLDGQS
jgi:hypothetical protein